MVGSMGKPKKSPREKDLTSRYVSGRLDDDLDTDLVRHQQRFTQRNSFTPDPGRPAQTSGASSGARRTVAT